MIRILASLAILSGTVAFLVPKYDDLSYCPEGLRPYSPHSLNPLNISLFFTGYETLSIEERKDCKWDILETNDQLLKGETAVFHNTEYEIKVIPGNMIFEQMYILQGEKGSKKMVYFSEKPNNGIDGHWNHLENVTVETIEENQPRSVEIQITNPYFFSFFLKKGIARLKCNQDQSDKNRCACGTGRCDREKNKLKILDFEINEEDETFILHLDKNFDYYSVYQFDLDLDIFFKSELTLEFNVIKK